MKLRMSHGSRVGCPSGMTFRAALLALAFAACGPAEEVQVSAAPIVVSSAQPEGCPATWQEARTLCAQQAPCALGSRCSYPGVGDQLPDGRWADGALICFDQTGTASAGDWRCAQ